MVYEIILGRGKKDRDKYGTTGCVFLAKQYVKMAQITALAQKVFLDMNNAHVVFVCGKRGSGKSYCMGVIAEGIVELPDEFKNRLSVILLDTMGIYWTMKYPNHKDEGMLNDWDLHGKGFNDVKIFTPEGYYNDYKKQGIPTDVPFSIKPSELTPEDWFISFEVTATDPLGAFIEKVILTIKEEKDDYDIDDIIAQIRMEEEDPHLKLAATNRFLVAKSWGLFSKQGTNIKDLAVGGQITVLDMSCYGTMPGGWKVKNLAMGIICKRLFIERMLVRKFEEFGSIEQATHYLEKVEKKDHSHDMPLVWIMIDEAHEFLPRTGKTAASDALITLLREGRQPGLAMVMVTQQPGKIHTDALTQSDIVLSHRLTAKIDTDALGLLMQSYLRTGLDRQLEVLPQVTGACLAIDDVNERIFPMQIRPRSSWHGGSAPKIMEDKKDPFKF
tara:strand:+ start:175 stop:1503 length:1329 start_codon:yes stop_codon:yes gene_type:complete